uniref:WW domain-containing protein n=1 Tax=Eptatretus burgeri TaxID=7764 RepID=A0A8C4Q9F9_EPTBU
MVQDTREEGTSLPQGWEKWRCHSSGLFYYYDRTTKCRQWGRPGRTTEQQCLEMMEQFMQRMMHEMRAWREERDAKMDTNAQKMENKMDAKISNFFQLLLFCSTANQRNTFGDTKRFFYFNNSSEEMVH